MSNSIGRFNAQLSYKIKKITLKHYTFFIQLIWISLACASSGYSQEILFPGLTGNDLLNAVQAAYTPDLDLGYARARDTLYARIDVRDDTVHGIYTDYGVYLQPGTDPTTTLFAGGINTEHIYPQGKGATDGTPPYSNMHHLAATLANVNSDRANSPFAEISDNVTDKWYYLDQQMTSIPSTNINKYSESTGNHFEPRESVKGNVARAVFYIHAIYRDQVMAVDPVFFMEQQADLCSWHFADPVDETEMTRTSLIAGYQDDKENPFVLDCTLAERMYCSGVGQCMVGVADNRDLKSSIQIRQNDLTNEFRLFNQSSASISFAVTMHSIDGRLVSTRDINELESQMDVGLSSELNSGAYIITVKTDQGSYFAKLVVVH